MGQLYDARMKIEAIIKEKKLDEYSIRGKIGMKSGLILALLKPETPDDAEKLGKLQSAVQEILNVKL
ncbi:MAG TPA: hypothetical protein VK470_03315 [Bacteroidota bacterium]|nr:hypothetical protein [Bacteroidota bacterium]